MCWELQVRGEQDMYTPCPPAVEMLAGERETKALIPFLLYCSCVTAKERPWVPGKCVRGTRCRREDVNR